MECDVPYKYLQILGYGYRQARVQVQEHLHESVHHIDCESADWLPVQHIVVCVYATDMLSFPFNCDDWNVIGSKLLGRKSMAQYNQTFNFISHQFIQVLLFQFLFVTAYEYKEFVVVVTVAGQKLIQHLRIVVQI